MAMPGQIRVVGDVVPHPDAVPPAPELQERGQGDAHRGRQRCQLTTDGTTALLVVLLGFGLSGHLRFAGWPGGWWLYLGGLFALVVTGANMIAVQSIGVLRTALCALAGQIIGGLAIDSLVPNGARPTLWVFCGASLTMVAALAAGFGRRRHT